MTLGIILAIVYTLAWIPLYVIRAESLPDALTQYDRREGAAAVAASATVSVHVTLACLTLTFTRAPIPPWSGVLMVLIAASGVAFYAWARRMIAPLTVRRLPEETPLVLKRHGAFGIVRHPMYLGMLTCAAAPLAAVPRLYLVATFAACFGALAMRALQDEARLTAQLGEDYVDYCRGVKRLVPLVW